MTVDDKGQVSIEFILIVGAILLMTVVGIPFTLKNAEMNKGLAAARDGATFGAAMRGMGYAGSGVSQQPSGIVKIINITPIYLNDIGGKKEYRLRFYVSIPSDMDSGSICPSINTEARRYLAYAFTGQWPPPGAIVPLSNTTGSYYIFRVGCSASS